MATTSILSTSALEIVNSNPIMNNNQYIFESEIHNPTTWAIVGTVSSTYLTDSNGNRVINKETENPYIVPLNYDPYKPFGPFI